MYFIKNKIKIALVKAQAALEFLMTYGWAILVVLAAIASLAYFGVLSPDMFLPQRCSLPVGIACLDYEAGSSRVNLVLRNNFGETITINRIDVAKKGGSSCSNTYPIDLKNNEKLLFVIINCNNGNIGEKFDGDINITYTKESGLSHLTRGNMRARIMMYNLISSPSECQNAQDQGLCGGLDTFFGEGYRAACCGEHGLCC